MSALNLTYYYQSSDKERDDVLKMLKELCKENEVVLVDICIDNDVDVRNRFESMTPVVCIGPYILKDKFSTLDVKVAIKAATEKYTSASEEPPRSKELVFSKTEKFTLFFSKYYPLFISAFLFIFIGIPILAPVLYNNGNTKLASGIYKTYQIICHELAFRSFYFYGEQAFYPRELAGIDGVKTYEEVTHEDHIDLAFARTFIGNEELGYKIAICQRDIAIYGSLALFGILFMMTKKRIKGLKWYLWFIIALIPIALDGFSQIPGLSSGWPVWIPIRESTPFLRIMTGTLFGAGTAWYMFPLMEESMKDTRINLTRKKEIVKKIHQSGNEYQ